MNFDININNLDCSYVSFVITPKTADIRDELNLSEVVIIFKKASPFEFSIIVTKNSLSESLYISKLINQFESSMEDTAFFCTPGESDLCYSLNSIDHPMSIEEMHVLLINFLRIIEAQNDAENPWIQKKFSSLLEVFFPDLIINYYNLPSLAELEFINTL